jgi:hypothetical protein
VGARAAQPACSEPVRCCSLLQNCVHGMLTRLVGTRVNGGFRSPRVHQLRGFCAGEPTTFYSSQSGLTVDLPTGIHLHDVGLQGVPLPANEAERAAWERILSSYASSDRIRSVELPGGLAGDGIGPAWAEALLGSDTAAAISDTDGAFSSWSQSSIVAVVAAVGKVDGLDPDASVEYAVNAAAEVCTCCLTLKLIPATREKLAVARAPTVARTYTSIVPSDCCTCRLAKPGFAQEHWSSVLLAALVGTHPMCTRYAHAL